MYHEQEDYDIEEEFIHIPRRFEELENMEAYGVYTTNKDEWQLIHYLNHFSSSQPLDNYPTLLDMKLPDPCSIGKSYEHYVVNYPMRERFAN